MTITASALTKSVIVSVFGLTIPLTLHQSNLGSAFAGFIGGATAGIVASKSSNSRSKEEETTSTSHDVVTLVTDTPEEELSIASTQESDLDSTPDNKLVSLLEQKGITVIKDRQLQEEDELLDPIASYLGKRYPILQKLHSRIKASIADKSSFSLNLYGKTQQEIQSCTQYCNKLYRATLLSHYHYDKRKKIIRGTVQRRGDIIQFLNGGWFERATLSQVKEKFAECQNLEFLVNPHLKFANGDRFELDILFLVDNELFWIECKTGDRYNDCLAKYCQHRQKLGVTKERAFLVGLGLSEQDAEKWTKLWTITVVNPDGLVSKL